MNCLLTYHGQMVFNQLVLNAGKFISSELISKTFATENCENLTLLYHFLVCFKGMYRSYQDEENIVDVNTCVK